ncbi:MAG: hypothetical protein WBD86_00830 [Microgenomates group bacterium]
MPPKFDKNLSPGEREKKFNEFLVSEYLKYGSVDEVLRRNNYDTPISYAQYQRVLDKWGIVKAAGPHSKLAEALDFLTRLAEENIPLEALYRRMPSSFRTSAATMYRILNYIKEGITRRIATGLIITPSSKKKKILVADDVSSPRMELGKPYGSISIPIGFSRKRDAREDAILRVLQQEVFAQKAIKQDLPDIIPERPKPFMFLDIADVRVEIFHLKLPKKISKIRNFSSYKLQNFRFIDTDKVIKNKRRVFRVGVVEAARGYEKYLEIKKRNLPFNPLQYKSQLNYYLSEVQSDYLD